MDRIKMLLVDQDIEHYQVLETKTIINDQY